MFWLYNVNNKGNQKSQIFLCLDGPPVTNLGNLKSSPRPQQNVLLGNSNILEGDLSMTTCPQEKYETYSTIDWQTLLIDSEDDDFESSDTNNSSFQNYTHPDDHTILITYTPGFNGLLS